MSSSVSIFDSTESLINSPESYTKNFHVSIITSSNELISCEFKMELVSGKIIIKSKEDDEYKIRFNLSDTISLLSEDDMESTQIHNKKMKIAQKYTDDILTRKKYAVINYYPKKNIKKCSCCQLLCLCYFCSVYQHKTQRVFQTIEMMLPLTAMKEIKNEIIKRNSNNTILLSSILTTKKKYIFFTNNEYTRSSSVNVINAVFSKADLDITNYDVSQIEDIINDLSIDECNGILFVDKNIIAHEVINAIMKRNDYNIFLNKIPIGAIPINNSSNGLFQTIAFESKEEVNGESAAFIIAKGQYKEIDIMQITGENKDNELLPENKDYEVVYSLVYLSMGNLGRIDAKLINGDSCCSSFAKKINYLCGAMSAKPCKAMITYTRYHEEKEQSINPEKTAVSYNVSASNSEISANISGLTMRSFKQKIIDENISYLLCSNLPYISQNMHSAPKTSSNSGFCDLIVMKSARAGVFDIKKQIAETQYTGDYFFENGKLNRGLKVNYISSSEWSITVKGNENALFYIDGKEYRYNKIGVKVLPMKVKIFCINNY